MLLHPGFPTIPGRPTLLSFQVLGGDDLAAEYLLLQLVGRCGCSVGAACVWSAGDSCCWPALGDSCSVQQPADCCASSAFACLPACLLSRVHHRTPQSTVGVMSLNLVAEPNTAAAAAAAPPAGAQQAQQAQQLSPLGAAVAAALEALAPRCRTLPLSIDALNRRPWWPRRDQNSQRLISGPLQLAHNTQVGLVVGVCVLRGIWFSGAFGTVEPYASPVPLWAGCGGLCAERHFL